MKTRSKTASEFPGDSLTEPFSFCSRLRSVETRFDFVPVIDLIVIAMLVSLLFTRFVILPGVRVELPPTDMMMQHTQNSVAVLTVANNNMLFFDGAVFEMGTIRDAFERYIAEAEADERVLLLKADFAMEMQDFLRLCELVQGAGFTQMQLTGKHKDIVGDLMPGDVRASEGIGY